MINQLPLLLWDWDKILEARIRNQIVTVLARSQFSWFDQIDTNWLILITLAVWHPDCVVIRTLRPFYVWRKQNGHWLYLSYWRPFVGPFAQFPGNGNSFFLFFIHTMFSFQRDNAFLWHVGATWIFLQLWLWRLTVLRCFVFFVKFWKINQFYGKFGRTLAWLVNHFNSSFNEILILFVLFILTDFRISIVSKLDKFIMLVFFSVG